MGVKWGLHPISAEGALYDTLGRGIHDRQMDLPPGVFRNNTI